MQRITRHNYEEYFLDYLEGRIDAIGEEMVLQFLEENPDLAEELHNFEQILVPVTDDHVYSEKYELKKTPVISVGIINENTYQEYFIASHENDLNNSEQRILSRFLERNPALVEEYHQFKLTYLPPQESTSYPLKHKLKRGAVVFLVQQKWLIYSAAAAIVFLLLWLTFLKPTSNINREQIVESDYEGKAVHIAPATNEDNETNTLQANPEQMGTIKGEPVNDVPLKILEEPQPANEEEERLPISAEAIRDESIVSRLKGLHKNNNIITVEADLSFKAIYDEERSYYSKIFPYISTATNYSFASDVRPQEDTYQSFFGFAFGKIKQLFTKESPGLQNTNQFSFWALAEIGIEGLNQITNNNIRLNKKQNEDGKVVAYALSSENIIISRKEKETRRNNRDK